MGAIQLRDEVQQQVEGEVAQGRAVDAAAFLEEAALRLVDDAGAEDDDMRAAVARGDADIAAGAFVTVATAEDGERLHERLMARLYESLAADRK